MFDSPTMAIIDSSEIYSNYELTSEELLSEINSVCLLFCFFSEKFKSHILANPTLYSIQTSGYNIQLIVGALTIQNATKIYFEDHILDIYESDLIIKDSEFFNLTEVDNIIKISSSNFNCSNVKLFNISSMASAESSLIRISFETEINLSDIQYYNSSASFLIFTYASGTISDLTTYGINSPSSRNLIDFDESTGVNLINWNIRDISVPNSEYIIRFHQSSIDLIDNCSIAQINQSPIYFGQSNVTMINKLNMYNCYRGLIFEESNWNMLQNSNFNNLGSTSITDGGAIFVTDSNVTSILNEFSLNVAVRGGALSFLWGLNRFCAWIVNHTIFTDNTATEVGGAGYYNLYVPITDNNTYINNTAPYGGLVGGYASKIKIKDKPNDPITFINVGSGVVYETSVTFAIYDFFNQIMNQDSVSQIVITANTSDGNVLGTNSVRVTNGEATFDNLIFYSHPGDQDIKFNIESPALDKEKLSTVIEDYTPENIIVNFRFCKPGEYIVSNISWTEWSPGSYSLFWNSTDWETWLDDATWPGGEQIDVNPGHWRRTTNSTDIRECPNDDACKGGYWNE